MSTVLSSETPWLPPLSPGELTCALQRRPVSKFRAALNEIGRRRVSRAAATALITSLAVGSVLAVELPVLEATNPRGFHASVIADQQELARTMAALVSTFESLQQVGSLSFTAKPAPIIVPARVDVEAQKKANLVKQALLRESELRESDKIIAQPLSPDELSARPYFDRIFNNPATLDWIDESATNGDDPLSAAVNIAAESSALPVLPKAGSARPQNQLQITRDQFRRLAFSFGINDAKELSSETRQKYAKELRELGFLAGFLEVQKGKNRLIVRYDEYESKTGLPAASFDKRLAALWTNAGFSGVLQMRSVADDKEKFWRSLTRQTGLSRSIIEKRVGFHLEERCLHFLGLHDSVKAYQMILTSRGDLPVVGNLMSLKKASKNFPSGPQSVTVSTETVQHMFDRQIGRWGKIYDGMKELLKRRRAQHIAAQLRASRQPLDLERTFDDAKRPPGTREKWASLVLQSEPAS